MISQVPVVLGGIRKIKMVRYCYKIPRYTYVNIRYCIEIIHSQLFNLHINYYLYQVNGHKYMLTIKSTTLLPINCYYGISVLAKNEAVLISIPRYTVFLIYHPTLSTNELNLVQSASTTIYQLVQSANTGVGKSHLGGAIFLCFPLNLPMPTRVPYNLTHTLWPHLPAALRSSQTDDHSNSGLLAQLQE